MTASPYASTTAAGAGTFAGAGSAVHVACVVLNYTIGLDITHIPYRGTGPAMQDLAGGRIDYMCDFVTTAKPQIDGGTVKVFTASPGYVAAK